MGLCKYCGRDAGLLRHVHADCEAQHHLQLQKHDAAAAEAVLLVTAYVEKQIDHAQLVAKLRDMESQKLIAPSEMRPVLVRGWETAIDNMLAKGIISAEQESRLSSLFGEVKITSEEGNAHGAIVKLWKAGILRAVMEGDDLSAHNFDPDHQLNFNLLAGETLLWAFAGVEYFEERTHRHTVGGYAGINVRVARGLYFHTGGFRGHPVESTSLDHIDNGGLGITNKGIYFAGPAKVFRVPYKKIVAFEPFSNAVRITKDSANAKAQVFSVEDSWFAFNLMKNLAAVAS
jgi:hypothetical protein